MIIKAFPEEFPKFHQVPFQPSRLEIRRPASETDIWVYAFSSEFLTLEKSEIKNKKEEKQINSKYFRKVNTIG